MDTDDVYNKIGFKVLPVKFEKNSSAIRYMYYKQHYVREPCEEKPIDRTLFVINVPPYCDEACMKRLFQTCGAVDQVYFHKKPTSTAPPKNQSKFFPSEPPVTGFKVAYLVFKKPGHLQMALQMKVEQPLILSPKDAPLLVGITKWCKEYNESIDINVGEMQREVDQYMEEYDEKVKEEEERERMESKMDDDGWTKVTKYSKNVILRKESLTNKITTEEESKRSRKELKDFYTFQIRETKMNKLAELRKKFEEDKQRISLMKASRSFKPY